MVGSENDLDYGNAYENYENIAEETLDYLISWLKNDREGSEFLKAISEELGELKRETAKEIRGLNFDKARRKALQVIASRLYFSALNINTKVAKRIALNHGHIIEITMF